jgi:CRP/FNR family cyclic AMP-dependent transcriptional regulator
MNRSLHLPAAAPARPPQDPSFDLPSFLDSVGTIRTVCPDGSSAVIFSQGDPATEVLHIQEGTVTKSVLSREGKEAVVAILGPGDFFGEECLAGQPLRMSTACALTEGTLLVIEKQEMFRMLHGNAPLVDWFLSHTLARLNRIEDDLADQRCNLTEKRLARTLLLLARYGKKEDQQRVLPKLSQTMLAEMVGTTRSRINFFMNKFKRQGLIDYDDAGLTINRSLLRVVDENESCFAVRQ